MNVNERQVAIECVERIHYLWIECQEYDDTIPEKITQLFEAIFCMAPTLESNHANYLWLAYRSVFEGSLPHLARYRWRLFSENIRKLYADRKKVFGEGEIS
jgi:hypothetical protein